ncbi:phosphotransferase enzyme family protein [Clostridium sp. LP20]|uniref:phosphotransferase enzyme family protein n=1 Tax=Clostridium sp. LP20 TaxID=3418665 RepID=UPI003EE78EB7
MKGTYSCKELADKFKFCGELVNSELHICGHINDTHILDFVKEDGSNIKYILQRINTEVFPKVDELMSNIDKVTRHISEKVKAEGGDVTREGLSLIKTRDDKLYYKTENGDCFRAYHFIEGAKTYMKVENPNDFYKCGKALGKFQEQLSDFPADTVFETIPDFHNTYKRYEAFMEAVKNDPFNRVKDVQAEINFIRSRAEETSKLVDLLNEGKLPLRVTHNDTKFNNIMIDNKTGEAICVIDLDTVMPGLSLYDYGDSIRSGATTALEDEADLSKVNFDINLFELFTKGFLESCGKSLTDTEIEYLPFSAKLITLELSMRFLMDHINGDKYFQIHRSNHNLDRARNQLKLVSDMEDRMEEMKDIVKKYS